MILESKLYYYQRDWKLQIPKEWTRRGCEIAKLALPFIALHPRVGAPLSYSLGLWNLCSHAQQRNYKEVAKIVLELSATYFHLRAGLFIRATLDIFENRDIASIISSGLYLLTLVKPKRLEFVVASLIYQACLHFYQFYEERKQVKLLTLLMGIIRVIQACECLREMKSLEYFFSQVIEEVGAKRAMITDPQGNPIDFGAFCHGYGKGMVRGANLCFRATEISDKPAIELSFKMTEVYLKRFQRILKGIAKLNEKEQLDFATLYGSDFMGFARENEYGINERVSIPTDVVYLKDLGYCLVGCEPHLHFRDHVKIFAPTLPHLRRLLTILGLDEALQKSTSDDLERMKIDFLFRMFYPAEAYPLERKRSFFELPLDQLKGKIVKKVPEMKTIFNTYKVGKQELLPGYFRLQVPIDRFLYEKGVRALTASVGFDYEDYDRLANMVKNGMFSQEMRDMNGIQGRGFNDESHYTEGGARSVYTQMIFEKDVQDQNKLEPLFCYASNLRFYFDIRVLNRGSYQYDYDLCGSRKEPYYSNRPSVFNFAAASQPNDHEVMVPDRILPGEIKGLSVKDGAVAEKLLQHFRKKGLVQNEKINGIPVGEFIQVADRMSEKLVKHCIKK